MVIIKICDVAWLTINSPLRHKHMDEQGKTKDN